MRPNFIWHVTAGRPAVTWGFQPGHGGIDIQNDPHDNYPSWDALPTSDDTPEGRNAARTGNPVIAAMSDVVAHRFERNTSTGNGFVIAHGGGYFTRYNHLHNYDFEAFTRGTTVSQGQRLGLTGQTGSVFSNGHLHFDIIYVDEFNNEEIINIYHLRWEIETAFDTLKNKLMLENFTGTRPVLIEQDIYASIYICNLASDMIADAEAVLEAQKEQSRPRKHPMAVNRSFAIGIMKELLISALLAESNEIRTALFNQMVLETKNEVLPIRRGRCYTRTKGRLAGKFANTRKRSF